MIYDNNSARLLLGCIFLSPQILLTDKYKITKEDFSPCEYHLRLYQACYYIAKQGGHTVTAIDLYNIVGKYENLVSLFDDNNTRDFVPTMSQLAQIENLDVYYEEVKKCSILRAYQDNGFDTKKFTDNLTIYSIKDIVNHYDGIQVGIKKEFYKDKNITEIKAGDGFLDIKEAFKSEPMFGATTFSELVNTATRGWVKGQLTIYSVGSGVGKSTLGLENLVMVCCPEIWDNESQLYIKNPCYQHEAGLYLQYEMSAEYEVTPKIIASISGVPTYHILDGYYENDEEQRVDKAIEILKQSELYIVTMPSFTVGLIENYIRDYVLNKKVGYVVFDYISEQASVSSDIAKQNGVQTRSDQVLSSIASKLKDIAVEYNIAMLSFTQVNANASTQEILDAGCVAGSRAVQNKCDVAGVIMPLRKQEEEICNMVMQSKFGGITKRPNRILHLYKIRFSSEEQGIKIWFHLDLNTGKVTDFFTTTKHNTPYQMKKTTLRIIE